MASDEQSAQPLMRPSNGDHFVQGTANDPESSSPAQDDVPPVDESDGNELDGEARLNLLATAKDQDELERDIGRQADQLLTEQADERDQKRLEKTEKYRQRLVTQMQSIDRRLAQFGNSATKTALRAEKENYEKQIAKLDEELEQITKRIEARHIDGEDEESEAAAEKSHGRLPGESKRDFLIRTGKITPFSRMPAGQPLTSANLQDAMLDAEQEEAEDADMLDEMEKLEKLEGAASQPMSHVHLMRPGAFDDEISESSSAVETPRPAKRRRLQSRKEARESAQRITSRSPISDVGEEDEEFVPDLDDQQLAALGESEDDGSDYELGIRDTTPPRKGRGEKHVSKKKRRETDVDENEPEEEDLAGIDDGNEYVYQRRLEQWSRKRAAAREKAHERKPPSAALNEVQEGANINAEDDEEEWYKPHPTREDAVLEGGLRIPGDIYPSLFDYQKTGVQWLWELYSQQVGGIVGDEMGLGKTIQVIAFLAGLHYSMLLTKPIIIVCPATVMKQWVNEFHRWWPPFRVSILHTSGSGMLNVRAEDRYERELEEDRFDASSFKKAKNHKTAKRIVNKVERDGHVLVTTYSGLRTYSDLLLGLRWEYAVLDEGHKIRNPDAAITIYCKELITPNRIILSGTPMQNNLTELWSLFDFVFPMRLGTLVNFRNQFEVPIKAGGYANASNLDVETAMRCAEALKETISPYLMQRFKVDVAQDLPKKSERVLFCKLTKLQRQKYEQFLASEDMKQIEAGKRNALFGVDILRKICNHPDLVDHKLLAKRSGSDYGNASKSGKMQVVKALLEIWKKAGHKTLLFAQHRIMLDILEKFINNLGGFKYRRMDGNTSIKERQDLVDEFNHDPELHIFLLTTKVGGLGVNLTGADRVIIYDPDWNPSTDIQARERAWRLGQQREVEIYRLMTAGTIEEKIYHRQIFKQFLTNKILRDPKQRQTFQLKDLHDLFTLGDEGEETETGSIFKGTEIKLTGKKDGKGKGKGKAEVVPTQATRPSPNGPMATDAKKQIDSIYGIAKQEEYKADDDDEKTSSNAADGTSNTKDQRLLSTIFARSGVQSAHEHDAILATGSGKRKITADPETIAVEARRVADKAAKELKRAGEVARTIPAGTLTWTGVVGTAGRPEERPRSAMSSTRGGFASSRRGGPSGPSSSSILSNLAIRQGLANGVATNGSGASSRASTPNPNQPDGKDFMVMIRDFLKAHGGSAYTQMLIQHFNRYCGTQERTQEFKAMLGRIATLENRGAAGMGRGRWVLKEEFRD